MNAADTRRELRTLLRQRAVLRGDFVLSSGRRSDFYLDARIVTLSSAGSPLVAAAFLDALQSVEVNAVAGLTLGADPIVSAIALLAGQRRLEIDGIIVRKGAKDHGTARRLEGPWRAGLSVAVVDDTLTTGASSLEAARAVEEAGGTVCGVYALIDREQGARQAIEGAGYPFHAIFRAADLLAPT